MKIPCFHRAGPRGSEYLRWIVPALLCAAPSAAIGLLMCARDLWSSLEIVGVLALGPIVFGHVMVTLSDRRHPGVDSWQGCVESALWWKVLAAVLLLGVAGDLLGTVCLLVGLPRIFGHLLPYSSPVQRFWVPAYLSLIMAVVVLAQVAFLTIVAWLARDRFRGYRICGAWLRRLAAGGE